MPPVAASESHLCSTATLKLSPGGLGVKTPRKRLSPRKAIRLVDFAQFPKTVKKPRKEIPNYLPKLPFGVALTPRPLGVICANIRKPVRGTKGRAEAQKVESDVPCIAEMTTQQQTRRTRSRTAITPTASALALVGEPPVLPKERKGARKPIVEISESIPSNVPDTNLPDLTDLKKKPITKVAKSTKKRPIAIAKSSKRGMEALQTGTIALDDEDDISSFDPPRKSDPSLTSLRSAALIMAKSYGKRKRTTDHFEPEPEPDIQKAMRPFKRTSTRTKQEEPISDIVTIKDSLTAPVNVRQTRKAVVSNPTSVQIAERVDAVRPTRRTKPKSKKLPRINNSPLKLFDKVLSAYNLPSSPPVVKAFPVLAFSADLPTSQTARSKATKVNTVTATTSKARVNGSQRHPLIRLEDLPFTTQGQLEILTHFFDD